MAKSVGRVHHALRADTLVRTSLVNIKKLRNKMEQYDAILVLMESTFQNGIPRKGI